MNVPNFFKYDVYSNETKIGDVVAPCKKLAIFGLKSVGVYEMFPNITIKFKKINI